MHKKCGGCPRPLAGQEVCWSHRRLVGLESAAQGGGENVQWDDDSSMRPNLESESNRCAISMRPMPRYRSYCSSLRSAEF